MKTENAQNIRNRELTKRKFLNAVSKIFMEDGMKGLKINNIARVAGMDKQLIYRYFKGRDGLVEAYIHEKDFWMKFSKTIGEKFVNTDPSGSYSNAVSSILCAQLEYFYQEKEMQQLILAEIGAKNELMISISKVREMLGEELFSLIEPEFKGREINIRATCALLVAGVYYMVLHSQNNGTTFCGININILQDREVVKRTLEDLINIVFLSEK